MKTIQIQFGTGNNAVVMTDEAESIAACIETLKSIGWSVDEIVKAEVVEAPKTIEVTNEQLAEMKKVRGLMLDKWVAKNGIAKVQSWMDDPGKLSIINALTYLEATGQ